jgi:hypothetical protein
LSSSHFKDRVSQPQEALPVACQREKVSFRRAEALAPTAGKSPYYELMLRCYAQVPNSNTPGLFLVSRAYNPNEVFVYTSDPHSDEIYLDILSTNVSIVHEPYEFGNVEV